MGEKLCSTPEGLSGIFRVGEKLFSTPEGLSGIFRVGEKLFSAPRISRESVISSGVEQEKSSIRKF